MAYTDLRKGRHSQPGLIYLITTVTHHRLPIFSSLKNGRILVKELMYLKQQGQAETLSYVIMPDHLHWLMQLNQGKLGEIVGGLKGRSAHAIGQKVWQENYHDHALRVDEDIQKIARYIVANPLRAKLVDRIEDYALWDAIWLKDTLG
jgi:REP element-mobilizing transposase RayT